MLLAVDIGNTNIVLGLFQENKLIHQWRLLSNKIKSIDDYAVDIIELLVTFKIDLKQIHGCIIGSVVPDLTQKIKQAISNFCDEEILVIGENIELNVATDIENKAEIGCDRLINSIAAFHEFGKGLIIIDFGTATTFDVVGENGQYLGGVIALGIDLSLQTLHGMTAKLPRITISKQENVIGKNTKQAMNSGVYFGYISLIEGVISKIKNEVDFQPQIIMTGGLASLFSDELNYIEIKPDLTLNGLKLIYDNKLYITK